MRIVLQPVVIKTTLGTLTKMRSSILRTVIYTIGHFAIAIVVLLMVSDVNIWIAITNAVVEPLANAVWYFALDYLWASRQTNKN